MKKIIRKVNGIPSTGPGHVGDIIPEPIEETVVYPKSIIFYPIGKNLPYTIVDKRGDYLFRNISELTLFWNETFPGVAVPEVDFSKAIIIATFSGLSTTTARIREIEQIWEESTFLRVCVRGYNVLPSCIQPEFNCNVFHIIAIPKTDKEISFFHYTPGLYGCFMEEE